MNAESTQQSGSSIRPGEILAGKYRVERLLGEGGMGVVVAAHHLQLDTRVAIKFLLPAMLAVPEAVQRFAREARAAAKITSEHVARVSDVGALETGAPYMVMEYLDGGDLAAWIQQRGRLDVGQAVDFVLQACEAIAEAHKLGIVHRDLKPANLFCIQRADGSLCIKVLDFGISKVADAAGAGMQVTKTTAVMGSPLYMSREQLTSSRDVDGRTDIWALGVILFELLTGTVPFTGESFTEICVKIATEPPPPLRSLRPDAPEGLEAVVYRSLEKDRDRRFANINEFAQALAPFAPEGSRSSAIRISRVGSGGAMSNSSPSLSSPSHGLASSNVALGRTTSGPPRNSMAPLVIGGALALLLAGGAGFVVMHAGKTAPTEAAAASQVQAVPGSAVAPPVAPEVLPSPSAPASTVPSAAPVADTSKQPPVHGGTWPSAGKPPVHAAANTPAATPPVTPPPVTPPPVATPAPPPKPGVKPGCDPNYYFDDTGQRHWKKECF